MTYLGKKMLQEKKNLAVAMVQLSMKILQKILKRKWNLREKAETMGLFLVYWPEIYKITTKNCIFLAHPPKQCFLFFPSLTLIACHIPSIHSLQQQQ